MKKVLKLIYLPLLCVSFSALSSCSKSDERVKLTYGEVTHQKYHEISYARLEKMISNKESFLLVVDPKGCACFSYFMKASEDYIKDNHLVLYYMTVADFKGNETKGIKVVEGSTSFSIFNKGQIQQSIVSNSSTEIMEQKDKFVEYVDKYIKKPNMYLVKVSDLDVMYHHANKSLIYFARNKCGDCSYINEHFLYDYMYEREDIIYVFDGDEEVRKYDEEGNLINSDEWNIFKENYGLASVHNSAYDGQASIINPIYGFGSGVVPTFFVVSGTNEQTTFHSGAVAFNDTVTKVGNEYKVTNTYYSAARTSDLDYLNGLGSLENIPVQKDEVYFFDPEETIGTWKQASSAQSYFTRVKAFLDTYLPQMTYKF